MIRMSVALFAAVAALGFATVQNAAAHEEKMGPTSLMKTPLSGMEGKEANVVVFNVGPDWKTKRHFHPGHVFVYVLKGAVTIDVDGSPPRTIGVGEVLHEVPGVNMVAWTARSAKGAKFLVFQVGDIGKPLMVANE